MATSLPDDMCKLKLTFPNAPFPINYFRKNLLFRIYKTSYLIPDTHCSFYNLILRKFYSF